MSDGERTGYRSLVYSAWHRVGSLRKLIGPVRASKLTMVDIDSCEACPFCSDPVALIETAHTADDPKPARITSRLAWKAGVEAYSVSYHGTIDRSVCDVCGRGGENGEIGEFRVRRIEPDDPHVAVMDPLDYADFLEKLRKSHVCSSNESSA